MSDNNTIAKLKGILALLWQTLKKPSARYSLGTLLSVGIVAGIIFWGVSTRPWN